MKKSTRYVAITFFAVLILQAGFSAANRYLWPEQSLLFRQLSIFSESNASEAGMVAMKDFDIIEADGPMELVVKQQDTFSIRLTPSPGQKKYIFAQQTGRILRLAHRHDVNEHDPVMQVEIGMPKLIAISHACLRSLVIEGLMPKAKFNRLCPQ